MTEYIQLANDAQVDAFRAEMWVRFYEDALTRWAAWLALPDEQLPGSIVAYKKSGGMPPTYGQPLDFHGRSKSLMWHTQACYGITVHPIAGGGGIVEVSDGRAGSKSRIRSWAERDNEITILGSDALLDLRNVGMDKAATRARTLLGLVPGESRTVLVKTQASTLLSRRDVVGVWDAKLKEVEDARALIAERARSLR